MIDPLNNAATAAPVQNHANGAHRKILRMVENDRMAGSVPSWEYATTATEGIEKNLNIAASGTAPSFESTLAYQQQETGASQPSGGEFGFGDLIDMLNPLHHIPVVGHIYRAISGDTIRPIGQVIGGAVFGGPLGAAGGLVNVIVQEETGKDITGNAISLAMNGDMPNWKPVDMNETPEQRLNEASRYAMLETRPNDLPGALLAFTDLRHGAGIVIEKSQTNEPHNTEAHSEKSSAALHPLTSGLAPREPITELALPPMPYSIY